MSASICDICGEHANEHGAIAGHQFTAAGECCGAAEGEHCARQYGICVESLAVTAPADEKSTQAENELAKHDALRLRHPPTPDSG